MLSARFKPWHVPLFLAKYAYLRARKRPVLVHFEVTLRCNARCNFCDYWKTDASERDRELKSFADAARYFNPMVITFTGGEPTLRRDLEDVVRAVCGAVRLKYVTLITHGAMLTPERATSLWDAGVNQFNISLDYLDERHDVARGIPGLTARIMGNVPKLRECGVNLSVYTDSKNGNRSHLLRDDQVAAVDALVKELLAFKRRRRGVITNSDYYLEQIPRYVRGEMKEPCLSGLSTIHVDPTGFVRRCPDFPADFHWSKFEQYKPIDCNACYYACRGEAQAPLRLSRVADVMGTAAR